MKRTSIFAALAVFFLTAASASAQRQTLSSPAPAGACCSITAMNQKTGLVMAKVNATGKTFEFTAASPQMMQGLRIGQAVFANFSAHQVSVDGRVACCQITGSSPQMAAPVAPRPVVPQTASLPPASAPPATPATPTASVPAAMAPIESQPAVMPVATTNLNATGTNRIPRPTATTNLAGSGIAASPTTDGMLNPCLAPNQQTTVKTPR